MSRVNPAKMLMTRSLPMTSEILSSPELPEEPSLSLLFEGGKRMLGMFIMGNCPRSEAGFPGELPVRKRFGRTISWQAAVDAWRVRVSSIAEAKNFMAW